MRNEPAVVDVASFDEFEPATTHDSKDVTNRQENILISQTTT